MTQIHPGINIGLQYIRNMDEYIPKLQIHQHRLRDVQPNLGWGHKHIIIVVDYFTKWEEAMPTFKADGETTTFFVFNQIIA